MAKSKKNAQPSFPIVGIGASAGGLEAFKQLLRALPADTGMGFVLVQHLDASHESILADLLAKETKMPVSEAQNKEMVQPDHVYIIPPNKSMTIAGQRLHLKPRKRNMHMPINIFLSSLAESKKNHAIGIVLSGTATDGTIGLKDIKEHGGITFAQDKSAKHQGMPKSAVASGDVDYVMPPGRIAQELSRIAKHIEDGEMDIDGKDIMKKIFLLLQRHMGVNFQHYKPTTIHRRIKRRMLIHKQTDMGKYLDLLRKDKDEMHALYNDFLIRVTRFFREPESFRFLHEYIFPKLIKNRPKNEPIRIWVPGCATGEEVYSIAISLHEFMDEKSVHFPVQIFGTDVSKDAIDKARAGIYPLSSSSDLSSDRISRHFVKSGGKYHIEKTIRDMCIFAPHNVVEDPPFSRIDLISCQNLMIYFDAVLQDRLLRRFHYSLKDEGILIVGKSESANNEFFTQIDNKHKAYLKKEKAPQRQGFHVSVDRYLRKPDTADAQDIEKETDRLLLKSYTPAGVVVNNDIDIILFRGSTREYLEPTHGKASLNLVKMAKEGLGFELRSAIAKVKRTKKPFKKKGIILKDSAKVISFEVVPLRKGTFFLVLFESEENSADTSKIPAGKAKQIADLKDEIIQTREDMRSLTEEQEATNEELQTANEEILSSNEELQSINEELETSKEELESSNEELTSLNDELLSKSEQLAEALDYADAIIRTVPVPLLILDKRLRVKTANRAFYKFFQTKEKNTQGKLLFELGKGEWDIPSLHKLLDKVLPENTVFENFEVEVDFPSIGRKVMLLNGRKFIKDGDNILLAFDDITERRAIEKQKDEFASLVVHELKQPITIIKLNNDIAQSISEDIGNKKLIAPLKMIHTQTDKMITLVNDILIDSKRSFQFSYNKKDIVVDKYLDKIIGSLQKICSCVIKRKGQAEGTINVDKQKMDQVFFNLVSNGAKFSPQNKPITIGVSRENDIFHFFVRDHGIGMSKEIQERLFKRWYQETDDSGHDMVHVGLGLSIAKTIIDDHGGKIWVESRKEEGTTFRFTIPASHN